MSIYIHKSLNDRTVFLNLEPLGPCFAQICFRRIPHFDVAGEIGEACAEIVVLTCLLVEAEQQIECAAESHLRRQESDDRWQRTQYSDQCP